MTMTLGQLKARLGIQQRPQTVNATAKLQTLVESYLSQRCTLEKIETFFSQLDRESKEDVLKQAQKTYFSLLRDTLIPQFAEQFGALLGVEQWQNIDIATLKDLHQLERYETHPERYETAISSAFDFFRYHLNFLDLVSKHSRQSSQASDLILMFQHQLFYHCDFSFAEISHAYFAIEYRLYEKHVRTQKDVSANQPPPLRRQTTEFFDLDDSQKKGQEFKDLGRVSRVSDMILSMGWVYFLRESSNKLLYSLIDSKVRKCQDVLDQPMLEKVYEWFEEMVEKWFKRVLEDEEGGAYCLPGTSLIKEEMFNLWKDRLKFYINEKFAKMRCSKLFEVIRDLDDEDINPEFFFTDLKKVLNHTNLYDELGKDLIKEFEQRLLVPGIGTQLIISHYIQTIRVLKRLDPSGVLLEMIADRINKYLRSRPDTLRTIVEKIIDDEDADLKEQLGQKYVRIPLRMEEDAPKPKSNIFQHPNAPKKKKQEEVDKDIDDDYISSDEDEQAARFWEPAPLTSTAGYGFVSKKYMKSDIISSLVNIYGSQDKFLEEFEKMMTERLLNGTRVRLDEETKSVELLKVRFGDPSLHKCDVMLKDMQDSHRLTKQYREGLRKDVSSDGLRQDQLEMVVISKEFWAVQEAKTNAEDLSEEFKKVMESFNQHFARQRGGRKLQMLPNYGNVSLTLTFDNGAFSFTSNPIQAVVINVFDDETGLVTAEALADILKLPIAKVEKSLKYWHRRAVLAEKKVESKIGEMIGKPTVKAYEAVAEYDEGKDYVKAMAGDADISMN